MIPDKPNVAFKPNSKYQVLFLSSPAYEVFGGGLPGGGKSLCLVAGHVTQALHPLYEGWTFRRNENQLGGLIQYARMLYPCIGGKETNNGMTWKFPKGGRHYFSHMNNIRDWVQVQGHNVVEMDFDELPEFDIEQYGMAKAWCRSPTKELMAKVRCTGNPYGPGVAWVKEYFVNRCRPFAIHTIQTEEGEVTRQFIPWSFRQNPDLMESDPSYAAKLQGIPNPLIRKAMTSHNVIDAWNIIVGAFFAFNSEYHVVEPGDQDDIMSELENGDTRWIRAYDYGGKAPTCMLWMGMTADQEVYVVMEYYVSDRPTEDVHIPAIKRIQAMMPDVSLTVGDPSITYKKPRYVRFTTQSIHQVWARNGIYIHAANNNKQAGFRIIHEMLYNRKLHIFSSCENLIRELSGAITSKTDIEDMDHDNPDHAIDCLRYGLMHLIHPDISTAPRQARPGSWQEAFLSVRKVNRRNRMARSL